MLSNRALDHASELEERERDAVLQAARAARAVAAARESEAFCQDASCGEPIPEARRLAVPGCQFCIECQQRLDKTPHRRTR